MINGKVVKIGLLMLAASLQSVCAAERATGTRVQISGAIVDPPDCSFNNDNTIDVVFGQVFAAKADGKQISKIVNYGLVCKGDDGDKSLKMQLTGEQGFARDVLATSMDGLGIRLQQNGTSVVLGEWFTLPRPAGSMILTASPVLQSSPPLSAGAFSASATLTVDFQ